MILLPGNAYPLGATVTEEGVNFAVFSAHATSIRLCFFDDGDVREESIGFDLIEQTGPVWHGFVKGAKAGQRYGYRVDGPFEPERGHRFNKHKVLLDPYAKSLGRPPVWDSSILGYAGQNDASYNEQDSARTAALGRVAPARTVLPMAGRLNTHWKDTIIYETHVKGLSKLHPGVDPAIRGTYSGVCSEPIIAHLKSLGVTAVQLQPVHLKWSEKHLVEAGLTNYWGYSTLNYFIPEPSYASDPNQAKTEFRTMVSTLHEAGIEVILDVVYNHTAEGNRFGPTLSYRGFDNASYYRKNVQTPRYLEDFTGTGNTLDANHPFVLRLIADSLRYWVLEMGVDGFRFDLATSLARDEGDIDMQAPLLALLQQDPALDGIKLIAEPWDLGPDGYQVGSFPAPWTEWNGKYRDTVRRFWRMDAGQTAEMATRLAGSSDLFGKRRPNSSINFVTAHDGFTLEDLVSYESKRNEANLEENRDGHEPNYSRNWGAEGFSDQTDVLDQRLRAKKALISTLFLSLGVPMLLGGDELGRTQHGNNNAYCQDNELNWYDWNLTESNKKWLQFCQEVIAFRKSHPTFFRRHFLNGGPATSPTAQGIWWHPEGRRIEGHEWYEGSIAQNGVFGLILPGNRVHDIGTEGETIEDNTFLIAFNPMDNQQLFNLPDWGESWTSCKPFSAEKLMDAGTTLALEPQSVTVFRAAKHPN